MESPYRIMHGDCLDILPTLAENSVDLVIADIPYFNIVNEAFDKQWSSLELYQQWIEQWAIELRRVVNDRGSIYIFADDKVAAYVQVILDKFFLLLNNLVWFKPNNVSVRFVQNYRSFASMTERILFYTTQYDSTGWVTVKLDVNNFQPLREYFREYQMAIGLSIKAINLKLGHRQAEHAFYWNSTQWELPTWETYQQLGETFPVDFLRREYDDLRREYDDLRRVWNGDAGTLDVITGATITAKDNTAHPTTKPIWLMNRLISVSSNKGNVVLDFTMGSGTTGVACMRMGRKFIGIELDADYFALAENRIKNANNEFVITEKEKATGQMGLL